MTDPETKDPGVIPTYYRASYLFTIDNIYKLVIKKLKIGKKKGKSMHMI